MHSIQRRHGPVTHLARRILYYDILYYIVLFCYFVFKLWTVSRCSTDPSDTCTNTLYWYIFIFQIKLELTHALAILDKMPVRRMPPPHYIILWCILIIIIIDYSFIGHYHCSYPAPTSPYLQLVYNYIFVLLDNYIIITMS